MKNATIALALAAAFSSSAVLAAPQAPEANTRAQVVAELQQAYASGELPVGEITRFQTPHSSSVSRAQVVSELRNARVAGLLPQTSIDYPPAPVAQGAAPTRAQVVQELQAARAHGELDGIGY